ncbi:MAG: hypothetical protein P8Y72_01580 [Anaerolineales bacterium]|jgi:hypothetical protein
MAARSSGVFPREKFDLDEEMAVTDTPAAAAITLTSYRTIRVVVIGAGSIDDGGTNKIDVTLGGQVVTFNAADLDANGVGLAHVRGTLCDADNNVSYTLGGTATIVGCYLDAVDNVGG